MNERDQGERSAGFSPGVRRPLTLLRAMLLHLDATSAYYRCWQISTGQEPARPPFRTLALVEEVFAAVQLELRERPRRASGVHYRDTRRAYLTAVAAGIRVGTEGDLKKRLVRAAGEHPLLYLCIGTRDDGCQRIFEGPKPGYRLAWWCPACSKRSRDRRRERAARDLAAREGRLLLPTWGTDGRGVERRLWLITCSTCGELFVAVKASAHLCERCRK